jgi:hypothetical protein
MMAHVVIPSVGRNFAIPPPSNNYDVIICGGTLEIFIALALLAKNPTLRVAVIEAAKLRGRDQEWNISRKELEELVPFIGAIA